MAVCDGMDPSSIYTLMRQGDVCKTLYHTQIILSLSNCTHAEGGHHHDNNNNKYSVEELNKLSMRLIRRCCDIIKQPNSINSFQNIIKLIHICKEWIELHRLPDPQPALDLSKSLYHIINSLCNKSLYSDALNIGAFLLSSLSYYRSTTVPDSPYVSGNDEEACKVILCSYELILNSGIRFSKAPSDKSHVTHDCQLILIALWELAFALRSLIEINIVKFTDKALQAIAQILKSTHTHTTINVTVVTCTFTFLHNVVGMVTKHIVTTTKDVDECDNEVELNSLFKFTTSCMNLYVKHIVNKHNHHDNNNNNNAGFIKHIRQSFDDIGTELCRHGNNNSDDYISMTTVTMVMYECWALLYQLYHGNDQCVVIDKLSEHLTCIEQACNTVRVLQWTDLYTLVDPLIQCLTLAAGLLFQHLQDIPLQPLLSALTQLDYITTTFDDYVCEAVVCKQQQQSDKHLVCVRRIQCLKSQCEIINKCLIHLDKHPHNTKHTEQQLYNFATTTMCRLSAAMETVARGDGGSYSMTLHREVGNMAFNVGLTAYNSKHYLDGAIHTSKGIQHFIKWCNQQESQGVAEIESPWQQGGVNTDTTPCLQVKQVRLQLVQKYRLLLQCYIAADRYDNAVVAMTTMFHSVPYTLTESYTDHVNIWLKMKKLSLKFCDIQLPLTVDRVMSLSDSPFYWWELALACEEEYNQYRVKRHDTSSDQLNVLIRLYELYHDAGIEHAMAHTLLQLIQLLTDNPTLKYKHTPIQHCHEAIHILHKLCPRVNHDDVTDDVITHHHGDVTDDVAMGYINAIHAPCWAEDDLATAYVWLYLCTQQSQLKKTQDPEPPVESDPTSATWLQGEVPRSSINLTGFNESSVTNAHHQMEPLDRALYIYTTHVCVDITRVRDVVFTSGCIHIIAGVFGMMKHPVKKIEALLLAAELSALNSDWSSVLNSYTIALISALRYGLATTATRCYDKLRHCREKAEWNYQSVEAFLCDVADAHWLLYHDTVEGEPLIEKLLQNPLLNTVSRLAYGLKGLAYHIAVLYSSLPRMSTNHSSGGRNHSDIDSRMNCDVVTIDQSYLELLFEEMRMWLGLGRHYLGDDWCGQTEDDQTITVYNMDNYNVGHMNRWLVLENALDILTDISHTHTELAMTRECRGYLKEAVSICYIYQLPNRFVDLLLEWINCYSVEAAWTEIPPYLLKITDILHLEVPLCNDPSPTPTLTQHSQLQQWSKELLDNCDDVTIDQCPLLASLITHAQCMTANNQLYVALNTLMRAPQLCQQFRRDNYTKQLLRLVDLTESPTTNHRLSYIMIDMCLMMSSLCLELRDVIGAEICLKQGWDLMVVHCDTPRFSMLNAALILHEEYIHIYTLSLTHGIHPVQAVLAQGGCVYKPSTTPDHDIHNLTEAFDKLSSHTRVHSSDKNRDNLHTPKPSSWTCRLLNQRQGIVTDNRELYRSNECTPGINTPDCMLTGIKQVRVRNAPSHDKLMASPQLRPKPRPSQPAESVPVKPIATRRSARIRCKVAVDDRVDVMTTRTRKKTPARSQQSNAPPETLRAGSDSEPESTNHNTAKLSHDNHQLKVADFWEVSDSDEDDMNYRPPVVVKEMTRKIQSELGMSDIVKRLHTASIHCQPLTSTKLQHNINTLSALLSIKHGLDHHSWKLVQCLAARLGTTVCAQLSLGLSKKLRKFTKCQSSGNIPKTKSHQETVERIVRLKQKLNHDMYYPTPSRDLQQQCDTLIPSDITIVMLSELSVPTPLSTNQTAETTVIVATRLRRNHQPITIDLGTPYIHDDEGNKVVATDNLRSLMSSSLDQFYTNDWKQWWAHRYSRDMKIKHLTEQMEECMLGCWKGVVLGCHTNLSVTNKVKVEVDRICHIAEEITGHTPVPGLIEILLDSCTYLEPLHISECIQTATGAPPGSEQSFSLSSKILASSKIIQALCDKKCPEGGAVRQPVILVLDKNLQQLPWEMTHILSIQPVSRMPSLQFTLSQLQLLNHPNAILRTGVEPSSCFYMLNPQNNLTATETVFKQWFQGVTGWEGVTAAPPSLTQYTTALESADIFMYVGHGSGSSMLVADEIMKRQCRPATIVMGCSSGRLLDNGMLEPSGPILTYLMAGCPCVVANLWNVTDKDIDRYTKSLLIKWLYESDCPSLLSAVSKSRGACKLKYLNGGAPVVYGLPVYRKDTRTLSA